MSHAQAIAADIAPDSTTGAGSMGLRGIWALVGNSTAMVIVAVCLFLTGLAAWTMHRDAMAVMQKMNQNNVESMGRVIERNTTALDTLAREIHALRTGRIEPEIP